MSPTAAPPDPVRVRRLAVVVLGLDVALTVLFAFVAVDTGPGGARTLFGLLAASTAVGGVAAVATIAAVRSGTRPWAVLAVAALVVSVVLLAAATTRDGGTVLPLTMLPLLLVEWWLLKGLRETVATPAPARTTST
jgi:FtsH-binding integral membrane protein